MNKVQPEQMLEAVLRESWRLLLDDVRAYEGDADTVMNEDRPTLLMYAGSLYVLKSLLVLTGLEQETGPDADEEQILGPARDYLDDWAVRNGHMAMITSLLEGDGKVRNTT